MHRRTPPNFFGRLPRPLRVWPSDGPVPYSKPLKPVKPSQCIIPVHRQTEPRKIEGFGSGVLIRIDGGRFLLSARHVLMASDLRLPGAIFLHLDAISRIFCSGPAVDDAEPADVGFAHLADFAVEFLEQAGYDFLDPLTQSVAGYDLPAPTEFIFSGYPVNRTKTRVALQQITASRVDVNENAIPASDHAVYGFNPKLHLAMRYDRQNLQSEGQRVNGPDPDGMSGGAIWHVTPEGVPLLAGIATHHDPVKKFLRGTRIRPVLTRAAEYLVENMPKPS